MKPYNLEHPMAKLIQKLEKGCNFAREDKKLFTDDMIIFKGITLLTNTAVFNQVIKEMEKEAHSVKTWNNFKLHFQASHRDQRKMVTMAGQGGYNATVNHIYRVSDG